MMGDPVAVTALLSLGGMAATIPAGTFLAQVIASERAFGIPLAGRTNSRPAASTARVVVIVPAHNEAETVSALLSDLDGEIPLDQVLVVADNCTDSTALHAAQTGVHVTERNDTAKRGKGFALAHGVRWWANQQTTPEIVIFLDADCRIRRGSLGELVNAVRASGRPAQAEFVMTPHSAGVTGQAISAFAMYTINAVRQRGMMVLGGPARLNGTGMAMPWDDALALNLATDHLVEDTVMGLDLALAGRPAQFIPAAQVRSTFPASQEAEVAQRQRWEGGTLQVMASRLFDTAKAALQQRSRSLGWAAADLTIPPLTRFAAGLLAYLALTGLYGVVTDAWSPALFTLMGVTALGAGILGSYFLYKRYAEHPLSVNDILAFARLKLNVLKAGKADGWVRTRRDHDEPV